MPGMHFWRCVSGVVSLTLWFYAIGGLPLATAMTLNYMSSVWMALFLLGGAVMLGAARVDGRLVAAVLTGFAGVALLAFVLLQLLLRHSIAGRQIVAVIHNREVATALGIDAARVGTLTFALAGVLGALGGALSVPTTSFVPGLGAEMIVTSFAVIATAGLGQVTGALIAAVLIGVSRSIAVYTVPELEVVMPYLMMVLVLLIRPHGLFSVATARKI